MKTDIRGQVEFKVELNLNNTGLFDSDSDSDSDSYWFTVKKALNLKFG